jgi:hypothetical protein
MASSFWKKFNSVLAKVLLVGTEGAALAEPVIDVTAPGISGVYNIAANAALQAEQAGEAAASGPVSDEAKTAAVAAAVAPVLASATQQAGLTPHTQDQVNAYASTVVAGLAALNTAPPAAS